MPRHTTEKWAVTRQCYWPDGRNIVEVAYGGIDYTNPGALSRKYRGEFEEFTNPREAAATAIAICKAWRADGCTDAKVAHGGTGGMTMPFDACTFKDLLAWAEDRFAEMDKCCQCGGLLGAERYGSWELQEFDCCSEYCAEKYYAPLPEEELQTI